MMSTSKSNTEAVLNTAVIANREAIVLTDVQTAGS